MFGSIWNGIKNFGSNAVEYGKDFVTGKVENVKNAAHTVRDVLVDTKEVTECAFTGGDVGAEWKELCDNFSDNTKDFFVDYGANVLNDFSNLTEIKTDLIQDTLNTVDSIYKPNEDNFQTIDGVLDKVSLAEELVVSGHDNIDPLKSFAQNALSVIAPQLTGENIALAKQEAKKEDGLLNKIKTFNMTLMQNTAINAVNEAIKAEPTGKISDAEISNTQEYNGLTNKEMLLLNNLSYTGIATIDNKGKTLGEITNDLKQKIKDTGKENLFDENGNVTTDGVLALAETEYKLGTADFEIIANILNEISSSEELSSLTILDNTDIPENGINATTYGKLDENGKLTNNATVVFQGTIGSAGWQDNAKSLNETTKMQKAAYEYIQRQEYILKEKSANPDDIHLSISGHSKGGNLAMFSTIENSKDTSTKLTIDNCLSFDGEGFNNSFVEENKDVIEANKSKITSINAYLDPVNLLLNDIAGKTYYVGMDYTKLETDENGNAVINELGDFNDFVWDVHCPQNMYKQVDRDENGDWTLYEKCEVASAIDNISNDIEDMKEPIKSYIVNSLVEIFGANGTTEEAEEPTPLVTLKDYNLTITKGDDGYNICDIESGNIVAKYDKEGNLLSGCVGQYAKDDEAALEEKITNKIKHLGGTLGSYFNSDKTRNKFK